MASGRFSEHALSTGATVVSFDYSSAVEANYQINGRHENLFLLQADVYEMPFKQDFFDKAFCFGVLQHTPNPEEAFLSIIKYLKPGGKIASDIYKKDYRSLLHVRTWVRPFVKDIQPESLYRYTRKYVNAIWPLAIVLRKTKLGQKAISRLIAERSDYLGDVPDPILKEWAYLDTFDWFSPAFDKPQTLRTFRSWHKKAGLIDVDVHPGYNGFEGRATIPWTSTTERKDSTD